jgi:hypothetical protein
VGNLKPIETSDGRHYLYTTTGTDCAGFGGIYEMKVIDNAWTIIEENLAPIDLKEGNVQIVGMKASKDWFVFITVEDEQVVLYPFNRESNSFNSNIKLAVLPDSAKTDWDDYPHSVIKESFYNASIQDNSIFNIEIIKKHDDYIYPLSLFYSVDLNKNEKLIAFHENTPFYDYQNGEYFSDRYFSETVMRYKNSKLYVLRAYKQKLYNIARSADDDSTMLLNSVHISVYENNRDVYQGELISAAEDDYSYQGSKLYKGFGETYMRRYYYLELE